MAIQVVEHEPRYREAVDAFNGRMRAGGSPFGFYVDPVPRWLAPREGAPVERRYFLAVDDDVVRAGYALKPQAWWFDGREVTITDSQGPFSEGAIDPRFVPLGLRLFRDMAKRQPHLYSWGHGGDEQVIVQLIEKLGWHLHPTPLALRVLRPKAFLLRNGMLRTDPRRRAALDVLAHTGLGDVSMHAMHLAIRSAGGRPKLRSRIDVVPRWESWADEVWLAHRDEYTACAVRDARAMNALLPEGERQPEWSEAVRVRVRDGAREVGWAVVLVREFDDHPRFGSMRVGTLADVFAGTKDAVQVVDAATTVMRELGADLAICNQVHTGWSDACRRAGWVVLPNKRLFALSPGLQKLFAPLERTLPGVLLGNLDGHGPMGM
ncbi:MAG: hypothetical protein H6721_19140 [Sandaracinus sp.]|nr:hypothetical protein [Sandaracinus sp.]MCB9634244.1 hypothetical protein [Sandaracinus sp.]